MDIGLLLWKAGNGKGFNVDGRIEKNFYRHSIVRVAAFALRGLVESLCRLELVLCNQYSCATYLFGAGTVSENE